MLNGIPIREEPMLAGSKKAVMLDGTLLVSPTVYSLMVGATSEELEHLLSKLEVVDLGKMPSIWDLPMTTKWDEWTQVPNHVDPTEVQKLWELLSKPPENLE